MYRIQFFFTILITMSYFNSLTAQSDPIQVNSFNKILVSPNIELFLQEGTEETVTIQGSSIPEEKINIKVVGNTLKIYLDDAKIATKHKKVYRDNYKMKVPIYDGSVVSALVTYKNLEKLTIRGEERITCESPIKTDKFKVKMFGEADLVVQELDVKSMKAALFGDHNLRIENGSAEKLVYHSYGESDIETESLNTKITRIWAMGDSEFKVNADEKIRFSSLGESKVKYLGDPDVRKGITIGENKVKKLD